MNRWKRGAGDSYDSSGNQTGVATRANTSVSANVFTYDGENRMVSSNVASMGQVTYSYDGEGRRVQKSWACGGSTCSTAFVYDAMGQLAAEYSTAPNPLSGTTEYLTADSLGSTRLVTDGSGNVTQCYDYLPFGEEIRQGVNGRGSCYPPTGVYPHSADATSMKFTGKERDVETGLDYFGARYFAAAQGRFTSPDWSVTPQAVPYANPTDPQTLNLYSYVRNNPLSKNDPDGHCDGIATCWNDFIDWSRTAGQAGKATVIGGLIIGAVLIADKIIDTAIENAGHAPPPPGVGGRLGVAGEGGSTQYLLKSDSKPGTLGKPDHQQTVKEEAERVNGKAEVPIPTPGGMKGGRRADAVGTNPQTGAPEIVQVYRPTAAGNIPKREIDAAADIENATGVKPTMVPVRPLPTPKPCAGPPCQ